MIKNVLILILLLGSFINAEILDAKQLFNKKITKVKKEEILLSKSFYGITKIDESSTFDIVSRFDGYITNLNANKSYMTIKKGEPLYSIYSSDILSIQNELQISKELNQNIYQSTLLKLDNLDIPKESQEKIKNGKLNNNGLVVTSPTNGILLQKNINNKSSVSKGTTLLQIASLDKIWFIASVYQEDLAFIKKDKQATIYIDGLNTSFNTKVDFIYPIFDDKSKTVNVRFILDNKELNLLPSMFGKVDIIDKQKELLTLPKTAVLKKSDSFYVFKYVSNDEFKPVKIEAKRINSNKYEIISGLNENDEVIDNALFLLDSDALTNSLYESDNEDW
ncbi:efflux RND transporter periplasmic adaptor subunit [Aliarcobacter butzleri]|uniref:efflux RND transporter periplasmic adaptor subunit n=1 Tax=Aliarcobacter butzleri TaxID=28197 RepID=UPI00125EC5AA|nr:efflux RND transporter periplasmic adaptor subunit [Aliarcobacter butzleri]MCG3684921.1 efflux RND transporter periplasmic adaptor subunit [Aliarcobacter butzleri]MCG3705121.1 efflux RND transporter periplasmic adaptor subunit [Aliarcobacter butzleri]MCT7562463.1 efflux RND transporter periplasmic adaptor subunit [Aliarcobacter butzleri]MCT7596217.1 efflux RND transporter periplasmic adaptor subunit [Aliarcobacter butzleri]